MGIVVFWSIFSSTLPRVFDKASGKPKGKGIKKRLCFSGPPALWFSRASFVLKLVPGFLCVAPFAYLDSEFGAAAKAAAVAAASGYLFVKTTACGFTPGAHLTLVERFVTVAAASCFVFKYMVAAAAKETGPWAAAFVGSLALVAGQFVTLSGILVLFFSVCAGFCWAIARVSRRGSLEPCASGDVLGLRLLGGCDFTPMSQRCVQDPGVGHTAGTFEDAQIFVEALPIDGATVLLATTTVRGSRIACRAQATPRVDVDVTRHCVPLSVSLQVLGTHNSVFKTSGRFRVFVNGLAGRTPVVAGCSGDMVVDDFMEMVAMREGVPAACFYLVGAGSKALHVGVTLCDAGVDGGFSSLHGWSSSRRLFTSAASAGCWLLAMLLVQHGRVLARAQPVFSVSRATWLSA